MNFLPHSSASVERICLHKNTMKNRSTRSFEAETVKNRLIARIAPERIRHAPSWNQTKIITSNIYGEVSK